jgi:hypothetical protein
MMTKSEAIQCEQRIKDSAAALAAHLREMRDRQGYVALGFRSWTEYMESGRLGFSKATLYRRLTTDRLSQNETPRPQAHYLEISQAPEHLQEVLTDAIDARIARGERVTAGTIRNLREIVVQGVTTGFVDDGEGNPLSIAATDAERERVARQREHIDRSQGLRFAFEAEGIVAENGIYIARPASVLAGTIVRVKVFTIAHQEENIA